MVYGGVPSLRARLLKMKGVAPAPVKLAKNKEFHGVLFSVFLRVLRGFVVFLLQSSCLCGENDPTAKLYTATCWWR